MNNHLGNVRLRFSDLKRSTVTAGIAPFVIDMRGYANYYPFGMAQPSREMQFGTTRYGYNGKEMDNEWNNRDGAVGELGTGNSYDYGFRIHDPRMGRFLSEDPLTPEYPELTLYQYAGNNPIRYIDIDGLEGTDPLRAAENVVQGMLQDAKDAIDPFVRPILDHNFTIDVTTSWAV